MNIKDTVNQQIKKWVEGESIHNPVTDECTPDYSCCKPNLQAEKSVRMRYAKAWEEKDNGTVDKMLEMFLAEAINDFCKTNFPENLELGEIAFVELTAQEALNKKDLH